MKTFPSPHQLIIIALFAMLNACSWTPQVETAIYEDSDVSVTLITVTEESFKADHPVTLQPETIAHVLNGLRLQQKKRLLQKIFSNANDAEPMFTKDQASRLVPQLHKAFAQVTGEEHVAFATKGNRLKNIPAMRGTMYVNGEDLFISLAFAPPGAHAATKTATRTVRPDQEGSGKPAVVFNPKEALQGEQKPHWLFGGDEKNHVVINVPRLASLHRQPTTPVVADDQKKTTPPIVERPSTQDASVQHPMVEPSSAPSAQTSPAPTAGNADTHMLLEEIRALRKELADQKKAIDRLKREE